MSKLKGMLLGAAGAGLGLPVLADVLRGVSFNTDPVARIILEDGIPVKNLAPGLKFYSDAGDTLRDLIGMPSSAGTAMSALGLAGTGAAIPELANLTITKSSKMPTTVKHISGPGMSGVSISSGSSSYSNTIPLLAALGLGVGGGALGHKLLTKESSLSKYYYNLS